MGIEAATSAGDAAPLERDFGVGFDDAAIGMSLTRLDGRYLRVNRAFCALVGYDETTLLGLRLQDITHPDDVRGADEETFSALERDQPSVFIDKRYVHAGGHVLDVRVATAFIRDAHGVPQLFFTQVQDVTELVAARRAASRGQRRLERIIASATSAYAEIDVRGVIHDWNPAAETLFGWTRAEAVGADIVALLSPPEDRGTHTDAMRRFREQYQGRVARTLERTAYTRDGRHVPIEMTHWTIEDGDGEGATGDGPHIHAFFQDISERRRAEEAMRATTAALTEAEQRWRLAFEHAPTGIALVALDGRLIGVNAALCRIVGYREEELLGSSFNDITHPDDLGAGSEVLARLVRGDIEQTTLEKRYRHADGRDVWVHLSTVMVRDEGGGAQHLITHVEDITDRRARTQQLQDLALRDPLTGLANRTRFLTELEEAGAPRDDGTSYAVLFLDLDGFKEVNDTYGHPRGDHLLHQAAQRLERAVRAVDLAARFGGDEFAVLLPSLLRAADAETIAARVLRALTAPYRLESNLVVHLGVSIGAALADRTSTGAALLAAADGAMYRAKHRGKNTYVVA